MLRGGLVHGNDTAALLLERAAALGVQVSVARAAQLASIAGYVARARADLGGAPEDRFGVEAEDYAGASHAVVAELAARLTITETAAYKLVALALALTTRLPVTFAALSEGRIDLDRAAVVADLTEALTDAHAAVVDEAIVDALSPLNTAQLAKTVKDEVHQVDPAAVERRARKATAERHVRLKSLANGMAELAVVAPAMVLVPAYNTIEALAKDKDRPGGRVDPHASLIHSGEPPLGPDGSPLDQRSQDAHRADVAVDLLRQGLGEATPSGCGPQIFVSYPAAVGLSDQPAQLDRVGSVPAVFARELLGHHRFRWALTHPATGHVVGVEGRSHPPGTLPDLSGSYEHLADQPDGDHRADRRDAATPATTTSSTATPPTATSRTTTSATTTSTTPTSSDESAPVSQAAGLHSQGECPVAAAGGGPYGPSAAMLRFVRVRSPRCTAPGCRRPAKQSDVDHRVPWPQGPTCPCNLAPLCRRHHLAKHRFGWTVRKASPDPADPSQHWTSPLGHQYRVPAEPLLPVATAAALARERGVPTETWPGDSVDRAHPYGRGRPDWLGTANHQQAQLALQRHAEAHAPRTGPRPARTPPGPPARHGPRGGLLDDPPF